MAQMFSGGQTTGFMGQEPQGNQHHIPGYSGYIPHVYPGNLFGKTYGVITSIASMKSQDGESKENEHYESTFTQNFGSYSQPKPVYMDKMLEDRARIQQKEVSDQSLHGFWGEKFESFPNQPRMTQNQETGDQQQKQVKIVTEAKITRTYQQAREQCQQ